MSNRWTVALLTLIPLVAIGAAWDAGYEASPDGATDLISSGDDQLRALKLETRKRAEVEHNFGSGSTTDTGLHTIGSARCFVQTGAPTALVRDQYNSATGLAGGTTLTTTEVNGGTQDIGTGRCWIDTDGPDNVANTPDDYSLAIWNETTNVWLYAGTANPDAATVALQRYLFDPGKYNLVYNGSFEVTDGTGLVASTTVPAGWALVATNPTISYTSPPASTEGLGIKVNLARGAGDGGISQTLTSLKSDTTYYAIARVIASGGATCELATINAGGTNLSAQTTASTSFTTLSGVFTTTAGAVDTLAVRLQVLTAGTCGVDSVAVYELSQDRRGLSQPGLVGCWDTDTTATSDAYTTVAVWVDGLVSCEVTVPGPGYIIMVDGALVADNDVNSQTESLAVRLREEGVTVDLKIGYASNDSDNANRFEDIVTVPVKYVNLFPTPGTTYTYTLEASPGAGSGNPSWDRNLGDDGVSDLDDGANLATNLRVLLIPVR